MMYAQCQRLSVKNLKLMLNLYLLKIISSTWIIFGKFYDKCARVSFRPKWKPVLAAFINPGPPPVTISIPAFEMSFASE